MSQTPEQQSLLEALLDSWNRNNTILVNLLRAIPKDALQISAIQGSPSIAKMFNHIHYVRLVFVSEDASEFAREVPKEWVDELDPDRIPQFGLVAEEVEKVNPDLVARDDEGKPYTVRYEAVNAMLLNEFLKEHQTVQELKKQVAELTAGLQKVSAQLEKKAMPQMVSR